MKKISLSMAACVLSVTAFLAGCGGNQAANNSAAPADSSNASSQAAGDASKPIEIDFWYALSGKNGEMIEKQVKEFNESQDKIKVNASFQGDYYENHSKVLAAVAAGNQPDVTQVEVGVIGAFAEAKVLEDLAPYANGAEKKYIPGLMGNSYWNDKLYAVPFNRSTPLLYVNRDMLKAAGLDPNGPKTWEELRQYAKALTKKEGDKTVTYGFSTPIDIWFYEALVFQSGGEVVTNDGQIRFNSPEGKAPLQFWTEMIKEGIMKAPPGEKYNAWDVAKQDFVNGQVAMIFTSTGDLRGLNESAQFEVGTAFMPANKSYGAPTGGSNFVILANSPEEEKKAAWEFINWMTDTKQTVAFSLETGYMPATTAAVESEEMKKAYEKEPNFEVAVKQLEYASPRPMLPSYKEMQEMIMTEIQRAVLGEVSIDEALQIAEEKAKKLVK